ncbi:hypothetical protein ENSA5_17720 [Enhygromyxa salina]|uniref:Uncharacterized protein n=1 Tax=Enhygromyxa salina TaxID=215803 RepID=A0A2S9YDR8_9BACT|nr:hypothetical protein [Enhygromyxa salina]PRQ03253.1 hypothetical protein ENSA5_17720 [Enhygromyxa salina]
MNAAGLLATLIWLGPPTLPDAPARDQAERADAKDLALSWSGPSECLGADARARVIERLGVLAPELSIAAARGSALVKVRARVEPAPASGWSVGLEIDGPQGPETRTFVAESCAVAIDATALVLAVAVDPVEIAARIDWRAKGSLPAPKPKPGPKPEPEPEPEPKPKPKPKPKPEPEPEPEPPSSTETSSALLVNLPSSSEDVEPVSLRARVGLALVGGGGYGPVQGGSAALGLRVAVLGARWRWALRGIWLPPVQPTLGERGRARVDGFMIATGGCGVPHAGPVEFPLCGAVEGGAVRAVALEPIQNPQLATQPYLGLALGPGLAWAPIERLALGIGVEATIPLVSGGFALDDQPVLDNAPVGVRALAGVELRLP